MRRLSSSTVKLPIPKDEIIGLQYLYNSTNGDHWDWDEDEDTFGIPWNFNGNLSLVNPCYDHWQGILCTCNTSYVLNFPYSYTYYYDDSITYSSANSCHITKIFSPGYNLIGNLPGEMFLLLPNLTHLHVEPNYLYSPLPKEINQSALLLLNIGDNKLRESLETLGSITQLQVLMALYNHLTGDLGPLKHLKNLYYVDLGHNDLTGTLDSGNLNSLQDLKIIWLKDNTMSGNLSGIQQLVGLKGLYLDQNYFTGSISYLQSLFNLRYLVMFQNEFTGDISAVSNLTSLEFLFLDFNYFIGTIEPMRNLSDLQLLALKSNFFSGSLEPIVGLVELRACILD